MSVAKCDTSRPWASPSPAPPPSSIAAPRSREDDAAEPSRSPPLHMSGRREHPLPGPLAPGVRVLPGQRPGENHIASPGGKISLMEEAGLPEMMLERDPHRLRDHSDTCGTALRVTQTDLSAGQVQVFDSEAFEKAEAATESIIAMIQYTPLSCPITCPTSSAVSTTGSRLLDCAQVISGNRSRGRSRTVRNRNSRALRACV